MSEPQLTTRTLTVESTDELGFAEPFRGDAACFALVASAAKRRSSPPFGQPAVVVGRRAPSEILRDDRSSRQQHPFHRARRRGCSLKTWDAQRHADRRTPHHDRERISPETQGQVGPAVVTLVFRRRTGTDRAFTRRGDPQPGNEGALSHCSTGRVPRRRLYLGERNGQGAPCKTLHEVGPRRANRSWP